MGRNICRDAVVRGQEAFHPCENLFRQFPDRVVGGQHEVGLRTPACQLQERIADPGMEVISFGFQPVLGSLAGSTAAAANGRIDIQQDGEVGLQAGRGPLVQGPHSVFAQSASGPLVGDGRIDVPVGQDDLAAFQGRPDDLGGVRGPGSGEDERFRMGINVAVAVVQHQGTQLFTNGSSAWLTGAQDGVALGLKGFRKPGSLR